MCAHFRFYFGNNETDPFSKNLITGDVMDCCVNMITKQFGDAVRMVGLKFFRLLWTVTDESAEKSIRTYNPQLIRFKQVFKKNRPELINRKDVFIIITPDQTHNGALNNNWKRFLVFHFPCIFILLHMYIFMHFVCIHHLYSIYILYSNQHSSLDLTFICVKQLSCIICIYVICMIYV